MEKKLGVLIYTIKILGAFILLTNSCSKDNKISPTLIDIDGNVYHTITVGTQVWMVENLKTTRYRNGDSIGTTNPSTYNIFGESTPKYQWAYNGDENNIVAYGRLYTWHAAADERNICPIGWHIPSDSEWETLTSYLGGGDIAGGKLKETGIMHWLSPNTGATNETGFTALPGGHRYQTGTFNHIGIWGYWWSNTEYDSEYVWYRSLLNDENIINRNIADKHFAFSVRCIKD
jgi:uncharacterized protein (TIGR02145 family)